jgi:D-3-phosphoglycerate dehydrogenase / 2-oxoglutarate reductase
MDARPRILLTHTPEMRRNYYGVRALAGLQALGDVVLHEAPEPLGADALIAAARDCRVVVADRATACPGLVFVALPDLVAVCRVAVDIRNIDVDAASAAGVLVTQASRSWVPAVSELVIGLMIDAARGIARADAAYKAGRAPQVGVGRQLAGATAGIIGYGPLGRRVAELALAFDMAVLVADPYVTVEHGKIEQVELDELLRRADFVLPLAVATAETEKLIGARELGLMRPDAFLVNLSRGNLIDEAALAAALDAKRIAGAALDVGRAPDQMPSPDLARRADVVATPHMAGLTQPAIEGQALETVAQAGDILQGCAPKGAVNAERASRLVPAR